MDFTVQGLKTASADALDRRVLTGARILMVEDEILIAMQLQSIFEEHGAVVVGPCHTLAEALRRAEHERISAATLDLNLDRDSAMPVAAVLQRRSIPFVFYSVQRRGDPPIAGWSHIRVISKPADPLVLVAALRGLLTDELLVG